MFNSLARFIANSRVGCSFIVSSAFNTGSHFLEALNSRTFSNLGVYFLSVLYFSVIKSRELYSLGLVISDTSFIELTNSSQGIISSIVLKSTAVLPSSLALIIILPRST